MEIPLLKLISDYVGYYARRQPDGEFIVFDEQRLTYEEVERSVDRMARAMIAAGLERGDRVAMLSTPRPEFFIHFLAATSVGAIWLGLNPKYQIGELRYVIGDAGPKFIFGMCRSGERDFTDTLTTLRKDNRFVERLITFGGVIEGESESLDSFARAGDGVSGEILAARRRAMNSRDPAFIVYTSGSTGRPKGALLSHYGLNYCNVIGAERKGLIAARTICNLPINHVGAVGDICSRVMTGGGTIFFQEAFAPGAMMRLIEKERLNVWPGVPTMFQLSVAAPEFEETDLSSVDLIAWGGAAMPIDLLRRLKQKTAATRFTTGYGMTETTGGVTFTDLDAPLEVQAETVGSPDPRLELRVWHEEGRPARPGERGEIHVRGDFIMRGYWQRPEATAETIDHDGWLHTGDLAQIRADGNLKIVGRISEMYKSGGYNVYPREIELCLEDHPGVTLVAVVSVPDRIFQEVGHAFVARSPGAAVSEDELRAFCRERLANYKVPKRFFVRDELPMLPIGKVDKVTLRKAARPSGRD